MSVVQGERWPVPTRADLFAWLGLVDTGTPGDPYDLALSVGLSEQAQRCTWVDYTSELHHAALRRTARVLASKGLALGRLDAGDFGPIPLLRFDQLIEHDEAPYRLGPFA